MSSQAWRIVERKEEEIRKLKRVADYSYAAIPKVLAQSNLCLDLGLESETALLNIVLALNEAGYDVSKIMPKKAGT